MRRVFLISICGLLLSTLAGAAPEQTGVPAFLDQGWSDADRKWFYTVDQGSELIDLDVVLSVENADSPDLFMDPVRLSRYGFVFAGAKAEGMPVGFVVHKNKLGFNCALCHTSNLTFEGRDAIHTIRVDGGASLADLHAFLTDMEFALAATLASKEKFSRYQSRMAAKKVPPAKSKPALEAALAERREYNKRNKPAHAYGFARLDAFGRIYNRVLSLSGSPSSVAADAPVSYPFLWDAPHHDYVQWVGGVSNNGAGSLARNVGQVVGVFGSIDLGKLPNPAGYGSSIEVGNLIAIEQKLSRLVSPKWPEGILPPIDRNLAAEGRSLYQKHCLSCHADINRTDPKRRITAQMFDIDIVGTDRLTALRAVEGKGYSGVLNGRPRHFTPGIHFIRGVEPVHSLLSHVVEGILIRNAGRLAQNQATNAYGFPGPRQGKFRTDPANPLVSLLAYKARPMNGIWATAPYLHNGSVPTLADLLLPAKERPAKFRLGTNRFDAQKVGLKDQGPFEFDTSLPGDSNAGHEYGTGLSPRDRSVLLEYMKTL
jgi:hypothetical protein